MHRWLKYFKNSFRGDTMKEDKNKEKKGTPKYAPGLDDEKIVYQSASKEDIKKGNSTKVTRVYLDENEPS